MQPINGNPNQHEMLAPPLGSAAARNAWVVFQLRLKGESLSSLSRKHGLVRTAISQALYLPHYLRYERIIAEELGVTPDQLFPERYQEGVRIGGRGARHA